MSVVRTSGGAAGRRTWLRRRLWWKVGWGWMALAFLLLSVVAMSVIVGWLARQARGSVPPALVLHTAINFWPTLVVT